MDTPTPMSAASGPEATAPAPRPSHLAVVHAHATKRTREAVLRSIRQQLDFHVASVWKYVAKADANGKIVGPWQTRPMAAYNDGHRDIERSEQKTPDLEAAVADTLYRAVCEELALLPDGAAYEAQITQEAALIDVKVKVLRSDHHLAQGE